MGMISIREEDLCHFWKLTCFWTMHFNSPGFEKGYTLDTRHGPIGFDKKGVTDWVMAIDGSHPPDMPGMLLRSGRRVDPADAFPSQPPRPRRRRRRPQRRQRQAKSSIRELISPSDYSALLGSASRASF
ncbi:hypothetical protein GGR58DRAFT_483346 [Xylaria digitata]|nr:hypothetical protein GGR58DRAFT_483346 [Xylaria digitata]